MIYTGNGPFILAPNSAFNADKSVIVAFFLKDNVIATTEQAAPPGTRRTRAKGEIPHVRRVGGTFIEGFHTLGREFLERGGFYSKRLEETEQVRSWWRGFCVRRDKVRKD